MVEQSAQCAHEASNTKNYCLDSPMRSLPVFICVLLSILVCSVAVDRSKFRTCQDTSFCRIYRNNRPERFYHVIRDSLSFQDGEVNGLLQSGGNHPLRLSVKFQRTGSVRVKISEKDPRWQPTDLLLPTHAELGSYHVASTEDLPLTFRTVEPSKFTALRFSATTGSKNVVVIEHDPFVVHLFEDGVLTLTMNGNNNMHFEQSLALQDTNAVANSEDEIEDRHKGKDVVDYGEDGLAIYSDGTREEKKAVEAHAHKNSHSTGENFGGHHDSVPNGPRSVGIDFSFPCAEHVYGIPEHSTPLSLPTTTGENSRYSAPYRLYNLDVFEYELQETMALYGNIPLMWSHGQCSGKAQHTSTGIFWFNPSETFVDVWSSRRSDSTQFKESKWISESGEIDVFLLPGSTPKDLMRQYTSLTGTQALPPMFSLGYHQCRWNYRDEKDVASVNAKFEELDFPYDVLWLDIEHTNGKRYFTWDKHLFPNPLEMQKNITRVGRKMVTIIDPHIKRDDHFHVHKEATQKGLYIKDKTGKDFDGWCWPGSSSYLDFTDKRVRDWWASQFSLSTYAGSTLDLFTWNDMNEPSVFNGPEVSMPKDAKNLLGVEHREWHNLYGIYMQMATAQGQINRCESHQKLRPFVLTRAFWAGSQRFGAMWTGDNTADWGHLKISVPMLLSINIAGLSFAGADVGGFFGEPSPELFTRWYQAGSFTPFFRGHAHHDTKRREPWLYGEPHTSIHRNVAMVRYSLLPYWYTTFFQAYETGLPVMRPLFLEFPENKQSIAIDDQWLVGGSLMVKPVTDAGATSVDVYFPRVVDDCDASHKLSWYDLESSRPTNLANDAVQRVDAPLAKIPAFLKPGTVLARKMRLRRSSKLMFFDPYTLFVAPGSCAAASGELYLDDEHTFEHEQGMFAVRKLEFSGKELKNTVARESITPVGSSVAINAKKTFHAPNVVERVVLMGQNISPKRVFLRAQKEDDKDLLFSYDQEQMTITVKKPNVLVNDDWSILFEF